MLAPFVPGNVPGGFGTALLFGRCAKRLLAKINN